MSFPVIRKPTFLNNASPSDAGTSQSTSAPTFELPRDISRWQISRRRAATLHPATRNFYRIAMSEKRENRIPGRNCSHDFVQAAVFHATSCAGSSASSTSRTFMFSTLFSLSLSLFLPTHASRWLTRGGRWRAALERKYLAVASAHYRATACLR